MNLEKEGNAKSIPKKQKFRAPNVKDIFPVFHEYSDERRHVDFVAGDTVQYSLCSNLTGSVARNVKRGIKSYALGSQVENSSYISA